MNTDPETSILTGHLHFDNSLFDGQLLRALGKAYDRGADIGECFSTAFRIQDGDRESWYREWNRTAMRVERAAEDSRRKWNAVSAREGFLRATEYYRTAEFFLRDDLDDPRIMQTAESVRSCFQRAGDLAELPFTAIEIPYEEQTLPGYYFRQGKMSGTRPTVIVLSGYDSYCEESYCLFVHEALERGFNAVVFDGPGQGQCLRRQRLYFRPDWEAVVTPALDHISSLPGVDRKHMILVGRSFAGYLAPRAACFDHRIAALIADPGLIDPGRGFKESLPPGALDAIIQGKGGPIDEQFEAGFARDPWQSFFFRSRMAAHGVSRVSAYIMEMLRYSLNGLAGKIECPTLVTSAGGKDPLLGDQSKELYDSIKGPKELIEFSAEEGAGDHCEGGAPSRFYQKVFDRLEEVMGAVHERGEKVVLRTR